MRSLKSAQTSDFRLSMSSTPGVTVGALLASHPEAFAELKLFLEGFWDERLANLKREAEREERTSHGHRD